MTSMYSKPKTAASGSRSMVRSGGANFVSLSFLTSLIDCICIETTSNKSWTINEEI